MKKRVEYRANSYAFGFRQRRSMAKGKPVAWKAKLWGHTDAERANRLVIAYARRRERRCAIRAAARVAVQVRRKAARIAKRQQADQ